MASISKHGDRWRIRYRNRGERAIRSRTLPRDASRADAERARREIEEAIDRTGRWERAPAAAADVAELVEAWLEDRAQETPWRRAAAGKTLANYRRILVGFEAHLRGRAGSVAPSALNRRAAQAWLASRMEDGLAPATLRMHHAVLSSWWRWAHEEHPQLVPPASLPSVRAAPPRRVSAPSWEQIDSLLGVLNPNRCEPLIRTVWICRFTGLRIGQVQRLCWRDYAADVAGGGPGLHIGAELAKTAEEGAMDRWVPVHPALAAAMAEWRSRDGARAAPERLVVGAATAEPNKTLVDAWRRAGVPSDLWAGHSSHVFRKRFISALVEAGTADAVIDHLVGHAPVGVRTRHYVDPMAIFPAAARALAVIPPVRRAGAEG